ncbi:hypothetical protein P7C70_g8582, partial [Phenoliferia sp. Uapishka_3]
MISHAQPAYEREEDRERQSFRSSHQSLSNQRWTPSTGHHAPSLDRDSLSRSNASGRPTPPPSPPASPLLLPNYTTQSTELTKTTRLSALTAKTEVLSHDSGFAHLPVFTRHYLPCLAIPAPPKAGPWNTLSSYPNIQLKPQDLEFALLRLLSIEMFEAFISEDAGRKSFRAYLVATPDSRTSHLDLWMDLAALQALGAKARLAALSIRDTYLVDEGANHADVGPQLLKESVKALRSTMGVGDLDGPSNKLLNSLYHHEFTSYVKFRLVEHAQVRLGALELGSASIAGLGEAFCLTNPRMNDCPIVLCSPAFCAITGYSTDQIIGRNCRFLQGNATAPDSVRSIRDAVVNGEPVTQLLLNYRLDGTPFWCLLSVLPLRDERGKIVYFIGGQTNVSGMIASTTSSLSFLLTDDATASPPSPSHNSQALGANFSAEVQQTYLNHSKIERENDDFITPRLYPTPSRDSGAPASGAFIHLPIPTDTKVPHRPDSAMSRMGSSLFKKKDSEILRAKTPVAPLLGAAQREAAPLQDHVKEFALTYERVLLFRRNGNEVLFATSQFLSACGLPVTTEAETKSSAILHTDLLEMIVGKTKADGKAARLELEGAITGARRVSVACGIRIKEGIMSGLRKTSQAPVYGILHCTPLMEALDACVAFVAV